MSQQLCPDKAVGLEALLMTQHLHVVALSVKCHYYYYHYYYDDDDDDECTADAGWLKYDYLLESSSIWPGWEPKAAAQ
jgi:hypothetical protein